MVPSGASSHVVQSGHPVTFCSPGFSTQPRSSPGSQVPYVVQVRKYARGSPRGILPASSVMGNSSCS